MRLKRASAAFCRAHLLHLAPARRTTTLTEASQQKLRLLWPPEASATRPRALKITCVNTRLLREPEPENLGVGNVPISIETGRRDSKNCRYYRRPLRRALLKSYVENWCVKACPRCARAVFFCSKCRASTYCSQSCQKSHWASSSERCE